MIDQQVKKLSVDGDGPTLLPVFQGSELKILLKTAFLEPFVGRSGREQRPKPTGIDKD